MNPHNSHLFTYLLIFPLSRMSTFFFFLPLSNFSPQRHAIFRDVSKLLKKPRVAFNDSLNINVDKRRGLRAPDVWLQGDCQLGGGDHRVQLKSRLRGRCQPRSHFLKSHQPSRAFCQCILNPDPAPLSAGKWKRPP